MNAIPSFLLQGVFGTFAVVFVLGFCLLCNPSEVRGGVVVVMCILFICVLIFFRVASRSYVKDAFLNPNRAEISEHVRSLDVASRKFFEARVEMYLGLGLGV